MSRIARNTYPLGLSWLLVAIAITTVGSAPLSAAEAQREFPRVLLIGDSISIGYTSAVKELLRDKAHVERIRGNAQHTATGLAKLDQWLGDDPWDVIHFNWGLWDLCYRHPESKVQGRRDKVRGSITLTLPQYEKNLRELVRRLKATDAKLIWANTTPVPPGEAGRIEGGGPLQYNRVAEEIMRDNGIAVNDLHAHILPQMKKFQTQPDNVHFTPAGSRFLAEKVAESILQQLDGKSGDSP